MAPTKIVKNTARPPAAGKGRPKGAVNKTTAAVKDMVIAALGKAGGVEYLLRQSDENPVAFMSMVSKIIPSQVDANVKTDLSDEMKRWLGTG